MSGIFLVGTYVGNKEVVRKDNNTGVESVKYQYLIVQDVESYRVTSDYDYRDKLVFGDEVTFEVIPNVFNNRLYFRGVLDES